MLSVSLHECALSGSILQSSSSSAVCTSISLSPAIHARSSQTQ